MEHIETPGSYGPWTATPSESGETIWIGNDSENAGCVPGYADHPQNIANARLMAAAPEMLAALRELTSNVVITAAMHERALAVIGKAIGLASGGRVEDDSGLPLIGETPLPQEARLTRKE